MCALLWKAMPLISGWFQEQLSVKRRCCMKNVASPADTLTFPPHIYDRKCQNETGKSNRGRYEGLSEPGLKRSCRVRTTRLKMLLNFWFGSIFETCWTEMCVCVRSWRICEIQTLAGFGAAHSAFCAFLDRGFMSWLSNESKPSVMFETMTVAWRTPEGCK